MEIDYSQLSLFGMCPMKYRYVYHERLGQTVGKEAHFSAQLIHPSITRWYQHQEFDWDEGWQNYLTATENRFADDPLYTLDRAEEIFQLYTTEYQDDLSEFRAVCVETTGAVPIGTHHVWITKPDIVVETADGERTVIDIKASKWTTQRELMPFDRQFLGQAKLVGAKWMVKSHAQLLVRSTRLTRDEQYVDPALLAEWEQEIAQELDYLELCKRTGIWPKHSPGSCFAFNQECEHWNLCASPLHREQVIEHTEKKDVFGYLHT